ncbi:MAG: hypothetical protein RLY66_24 [Candidatus Parcubacteria bacterium]|jgi:hypothetical protein
MQKQKTELPKVHGTLSELAAMTCEPVPLLVFDENGKATGKLTEEGQRVLANHSAAFDDISHVEPENS